MAKKSTPKTVTALKHEEATRKNFPTEAFGVSKPIASRDLDDMVRKGVLEKIGTTGKGTYYILDRKGLTKGSKGS